MDRISVHEDCPFGRCESTLELFAATWLALFAWVLVRAG
jgi:hypothetical protein